MTSASVAVASPGLLVLTALALLAIAALGRRRQLALD
jgi:MYXO-CTERM domain-containing protein